MCPCQAVRDGAFVLAGVIWTAIFGTVFLGEDFATLLMHVWRQSDAVPGSLIVWFIVFVIGVVRFLVGVSQAMLDGDAASIPASIIGMGGSGLALYKGWFLPVPDFGLGAHLASEGFWVAFFVAALGNLWLALSVRQRRRRLLRPLMPAYVPPLAMVPAGAPPMPIPAHAWSLEPMLGADNASFHRLLGQLRSLAPAERVQVLEELTAVPAIAAKPYALAWPPVKGG